MNTDGIVLFAKQNGPTSFKSLNTIKKALGTSKVGHTGTLDSFAQGLLVVCTGRLTRLAGNITEFDKSYQAVLKFGQETDTLEYTGNVIHTAPLPDLENLKNAVMKHTGQLMQQPPCFSAIHIDGKRASDLARNGEQTNLPSRPVTVFKAELLDTKLDSNGKVEYALIDFTVSKGTYIRSLARDIAKYCGSRAHLAGLYRTKVGNFSIKDASGFSNLKDFTIDNVISQMNTNLEKTENIDSISKESQKKYLPSEDELALQEEVRSKIIKLNKELCNQCGFETIELISTEAEKDFENGKPLKSKNFTNNLHELPLKSITAVFSKDDIFKGLIEKDENGKIRYKFVIN